MVETYKQMVPESEKIEYWIKIKKKKRLRKIIISRNFKEASMA